MQIAEIRTLRWTYGHNKRDVIKNKDVQDKIKVASEHDEQYEESKIKMIRVCEEEIHKRLTEEV